MKPTDEHIKSLRAPGDDHKSHGCARHAPAGLVLATISEPQFRCLNLVAEAVRLARQKLSIEPYEAYRARERSDRGEQFINVHWGDNM